MRIIVLFNPKPGVDAAAYEQWARTTDIPGVRRLRSVSDFQVYRATGLLGTNARPPARLTGSARASRLVPSRAVRQASAYGTSE